MKRTITLENGKTVQITAESYREFEKAIDPDFKAGDWVIVQEDMEDCPVRLIEPAKKDKGRLVYLDNDGDKDWYQSTDETRHATPEEIEAHLIEEAERRGYKPGDNVGNFYGIQSELIHSNSTCYVFDTDQYFMGGTCIYRRGDWAEVINRSKTIQLNDKYEAEILANGDVKVCSQEFSYESLKKVYKAAKKAFLKK